MSDSDDLTHTAFFGDADHAFRLGYAEIIELERTTNAGIGSLANRLFRGDFAIKELSEIIRLSLIGAGEKPQRAAELVDLYVQRRPLMESYPLAVEIASRAWFGPPQVHDQTNNDQTNNDQTNNDQTNNDQTNNDKTNNYNDDEPFGPMDPDVFQTNDEPDTAAEPIEAWVGKQHYVMQATPDGPKFVKVD